MKNSLHDAVAKMAYHIWEEEGQPEGLAKEHWQRAEFRLMGNEVVEKTEPSGPGED